MPSPCVLIAGGGLAGLSCAAALDSAGFQVDLFEARPFPGGRAASYEIPSGDGPAETIDNGQHILLRCCVNLLDFYRRVGVAGSIRFSEEFRFIEPGGRVSTLRAGALPPPLHFAGSFMRLRFLSWRDKLAVARALLALRRQYPARRDLDGITMLDWLAEQGQPRQAVERFWRPILLSAVNEEPARMSALYGCRVLWLGFLAGREGHHMGVPDVPLGTLCESEYWTRTAGVRLHLRAPVERLRVDGDRVAGAETAGGPRHAGYFVAAVPFERIGRLVPELGFDTSAWEHSPITGIHLWFDRPVTELPHAALLDRTIQWFFSKDGGRRLQLVVSASRSLLPLRRGEVIELAVRELAGFLPGCREAKLRKAHVVKEVRATFSIRPGLDPLRPATRTRFGNLFLAGDWTATGWPATMEGAVRSGYRAAEAVAEAAGRPSRFLLPDVA